MDHVFYLNFEADDALARTRDPQPPIEAHREKLVQALAPLLRGSRILLPSEARVHAGETPRGHAWMMTDEAARKLSSAGCAPRAVPGNAVLTHVNSRAFSAALGVALPGANFVRSMADLDAAIDARLSWVLRREHGFAARGRVLLENGMTDAARTWAERAFAAGEGLECAVWVKRTEDFGLHGHIDGTGFTLGEPTLQVCDKRGQWQATKRTELLSFAERSAFEQACTEAATALLSANYTGPFGIDGFRYTDDLGKLRFCPRCEINARYSMGWAIGMGENRPDLAHGP
jgi:hypothetical protein